MKTPEETNIMWAEEMIEFIDSTLSNLENHIHGKEGEDISKSRKYSQEISMVVKEKDETIKMQLSALMDYEKNEHLINFFKNENEQLSKDIQMYYGQIETLKQEIQSLKDDVSGYRDMAFQNKNQ